MVKHNATSPTAAAGTALSAALVGALVIGIAPASQAAGAEWQPISAAVISDSRPATSGFAANKISNAKIIPMKNYAISAHYGHNTGVHAGRGHSGVDLAAPHGQKVVSATRGKVIEAGPAGGYGNLVKVKTSDGKKILYAHLSTIAVKKGDKIAAGDKIGREGSTGNSTGPHLHFEVLNKKGNPIDPVKFLGVTQKQLAKAGR